MYPTLVATMKLFIVQSRPFKPAFYATWCHSHVSWYRNAQRYHREV